MTITTLYRIRLANGLYLASNGLGGTDKPRMAWTVPERAALAAIVAFGIVGACLEIAKVTS